jgi:DNA end-binding protein Ku
MAARATWKGAIRLSLISIPIRVFPATNQGSDVSFRQLHRKCHTPIQLRKWCPQCEENVEADEIVRGYESSKGNYVLVEDEEIKSLRPESTKVVDISHVVDAKTVDPIYIERAYYLAPDGKAAGASFAVLRESLNGQAGVGRLAIHGREYLVAILARDPALMMYTLRTAGEVRGVEDIDAFDDIPAKTKPEEVRLARQVLQHFASETDLSAFTDNYQQALREMLESKGAADVVAAEPGRKPARVVDLMDALRESLARVSAEKPAKRGRTAKATRKPAKARIIAHPASGKRRRAS